MSPLKLAGRNVRAAVHYRPRQVLWRVVTRARRTLAAVAPGLLRSRLERAALCVRAREALECPAALREFALDPAVSPPENAEELLRGEFTFLGVTRHLGEHPDWLWRQSSPPSHLWRFNLHYHRFLVDAAVGALRSPDGGRRLLERAAAVLDDWRARCVPGSRSSWDAAWSGYTASSRILNAAVARRLLIDVPGEAAEGLRRRIDVVAAVDAAFVRRWLERDLGGNHLLRNATALHVAGRWFEGDPARDWLELGRSLMQSELPGQILPDGFHEERTPMYHALLLGDLLLSRMSEPEPSADRGIAPAVAACAASLRTVLHPDGQIALFNDSALGIAAPPEALLRFAGALGLSLPSSAADLPDAGYYRFAHDGDAMIFDAGLLGPDHLPAHAHCDALSFELSIDGARVVVDTGVDRYEAGPERDFQRATTAHSTLQVADLEQGEPFGSFRMGSRPRVTGRRIDDRAAEGSHDGYRPAGDHRRRVRWDPGLGMSWVDVVDGPSPVPVTVRLGLAPRVAAEISGTTAHLALEGDARLLVRAPERGALSTEAGIYCERFGRSTPRRVLCWRGTAGRGVELRFSIERAG